MFGASLVVDVLIAVREGESQPSERLTPLMASRDASGEPGVGC
ncbi:hypothetical protein EVA_05891 [gut metagenome]|uniref:Uncharacterized protein n=1 Tax=gut metagenome TaxID=749906 RepID=J9GF67_9ZZZZ